MARRGSDMKLHLTWGLWASPGSLYILVHSTCSPKVRREKGVWFRSPSLSQSASTTCAESVGWMAGIFLHLGTHPLKKAAGLLLWEPKVPTSSDHCALWDLLFQLCSPRCKPWAAPTSQRTSDFQGALLQAKAVPCHHQEGDFYWQKLQVEKAKERRAFY